MVFIKKILLICTFPILFISCAQQSLTIGIIGDQFGSYDTNKSYEIMETAVGKIKEHNPDVIIHVGDMVESVRGINNFEDYKLNFDRATSIINSINKPWIVAIGDHGVVPPVFKANSTDRSREEWFLECANIFSTPIKETPYYSIDVNGYHFISLYSLENLHTDPRWGSIFLNKISDDQINWLKSDLENHKKSNGIIIVVHHPMWYVWSNWIEIHSIIKKYPVAAVIAGHYHYDQDDGDIDGIRYLVMGSTGGVVKSTDANTGGIQEYGLIELNGKNIVEQRLYKVYSDSLLEWTPRISTDRIQAVSCMFDNLWNAFDLTIIDGKITNRLEGSTYSNKISISSLANPIDVPIKINISCKDSLISNQFWYVDNKQYSGNESVVLEPGYNVGWANYTSVGQWFKHPKIWEAEINQGENLADNITLSFTISFIDTEQRTISRDITYQAKREQY